MFNFFDQLRKDKKGVSLMEAMVTVAVFSIVIVVAMDLYFVATRSQRKVTAMQKVQSDARFSLEAMAREIRVGRVNYTPLPFDLSGGPSGSPSPVYGNPTDTLELIDEDGCRVSFKIVNEHDICQQLGSDNSCLAVGLEQAGIDNPCGTDDNTMGYVSMTPKNIYVDRLDFYISANPGSENNKQSWVTIVFASHNISSRPEDQKSLILQTTASSRYYGR